MRNWKRNNWQTWRRVPYYEDKLGRMLTIHKNEWNKYYSKKALRKLHNKLTGGKFTKTGSDTFVVFFNMKKWLPFMNSAKQKHLPDEQIHRCASK